MCVCVRKGERERERAREDRDLRLKRSRDLSLEDIAKYYVNRNSILHARLISVAQN